MDAVERPDAQRCENRRIDAGSADPTQRENLRLRELVAVYSHLSGLVSQDADVADVVRLVARHTGAGVALMDRALEVIASAGPGEERPEAVADRLRSHTGGTERTVGHLHRVLEATARNRRPMQLPGDGAATVVLAPVVVGDEVPAHLVTITTEDPARGHGGDTGLLLTEHAATICGIFLGRRRVVSAAAGQARLDLVEGLLLARDRDDGEAQRWAHHLGLSRDVEHRVLAAAPVGAAIRDRNLDREPGTPPVRALTLLEHVLTLRAPDAVVAAREREVVAIVPVRTPGAGGLEEIRRLGRGCADALAARQPEVGLLMGVGGAAHGPEAIARSYGQARSAVDTASRVGRSGVIAFEDLGIQRLLLQVPDLRELRTFSVDVLGRLAAEGPEQHRDLLATLVAWFEATGSPQRTARVLHVHPNTVAYRLRRVEEITGMRLDRGRDRLMLQVAVEIVRTLDGLP